MDITAPSWGEDGEMFTAVINQGIDARLEAFTKSKFTRLGTRLVLDFHEDEKSLLLRRLSELETDNADSWIDTILESEYGIIQ